MPSRTVNNDHGDEAESFLHLPQKHNLLEWNRNSNRTARWYLRICVDIAMVCMITMLLLRPVPSLIIRLRPSTPVPDWPLETITFLPQEQYLHDKMFNSELDTLHTLHSWLPLSPRARGYISLANWKNYDLGQPYEIEISHWNYGPGYMMSVYHQLHCLSYLVEHFQQGYGGFNLTKEVAHHSAHCFDYIRQTIMCNADTSLEGETEAGPGWGSTHQCKNYEKLLEWANKHGGASYAFSLMPGDSIL